MTKKQNGHKIARDYQLVADYVKQQRQRNKKIVLTQGSFDMLHIGHARYCKEAKSYGNILIVGVDSDQKIKARKGEDRPIVPEDERLEMLTYLSSVDLVVLKKLTAPKWELIKIIKPDVLIATKETYQPDQIAKLEKICGQVVILDPMAVTSTSAKIRLLQMGAAKKIKSVLTNKLINTIEEVLSELKGEKK
ncbi:MAG: adenylyltransferase/cytidyltransferase family protein [Patescibacteria group bacterium]